jgi:Family of unknown function (DUF695)
MFNFFKRDTKTFRPISEYAESWSIITEKPNPTIIRVNLGYKDAIGHPDYPVKMGIAVPVDVHDNVIMDVKSEMEEILNDILLINDSGAVVAIITGLEGQRFFEFLSYTKKEGVDFAKIHQILKDKFKDYEIQMYAETDIRWLAYKSFAHI